MRATLALACLIVASPIPTIAQTWNDSRSTMGRVESSTPSFVENRGQWATPAQFVARAGAMTVGLESRALVLNLVLEKDETRLRGAVVRLHLEGGDRTPTLRGEAEQPGTRNFFLGSEEGTSRTGLRAYSSVLYEDLAPGVSMRVRSGGPRVAYDLHVEPGADPESLRFRCEGHVGLTIAEDGALLVHTPAGPVRQTPPVAWRVDSSGKRHPLPSAFRLLEGDRYGLVVDGRNPEFALVIDPGLEFASFLGGSLQDEVTAVRLTQAGEILCAGVTSSPNFPTTAGSFDISLAGTTDLFVAKFDAIASNLVFATFIGGSSFELLERGSLAVSPQGEAIVAGTTQSADFPTTPNCQDPTFNGGTADAFLVKVAIGGTGLVFSTFLGGSRPAPGTGGAAPSGGGSFVVGSTESVNLPLNSPFDSTLGGFTDAFVAKYGSGGLITMSSYLGGSGFDVATHVAIGPGNEPVITGVTQSNNFPTTGGAFDQSFNGNPGDGFVVRLSASGQQFLASTYIGGNFDDRAEGCVVAGDGSVFVVGKEQSSDFPSTPGAVNLAPIGENVFVAKFSASLALTFCLRYGGAGADLGYGIVLDAFGGPVVCGETTSSDLPVTPGAFDANLGAAPFFNGTDSLVAQFSPDGTTLRYATHLGNGPFARAYDLAFNGIGSVVVGGVVGDQAFPTTPGAFALANSGIDDGYIARLDLLPIGATRFGVATPGCAGLPVISVASQPRVGNVAFALDCARAPQSGVGFLGISGAGLASPLLAGGIQVWINPSAPGFDIFPVASNATGLALIPIPLPTIPSLAGIRAFGQFVWLDGCAPGGVSASDGIDITIQP